MARCQPGETSGPGRRHLAHQIRAFPSSSFPEARRTMYGGVAESRLPAARRRPGLHRLPAARRRPLRGRHVLRPHHTRGYDRTEPHPARGGGHRTSRRKSRVSTRPPPPRPRARYGFALAPPLSLSASHLTSLSLTVSSGHDGDGNGRSSWPSRSLHGRLLRR